MDKEQRPKLTLLAGTALSIALFLTLALLPYLPCTPMVLPGGLLVYLVANPLLNRCLLALSILLPVITYIAHRKATGGRDCVEPKSTTNSTTPTQRSMFSVQCSMFDAPLLPLSFLPLSFIGYFLPCIFGPAIAANILFFLPLLLLSIALLRITEDADGTCTPSSSRVALLLLCGLTIVYLLGGYHVSSQIGEHAVDEGHYLMQAESLYHDQDLDIRNNFGFDVDEAVQNLMKERTYAPAEEEAVRRECTSNLRDYLHVSRNSRDDHWYSWHPYGISVLLAPAGALGMPGRQFILALISAFGCMITFLLCERTTASRRWSLLLTILLAMSSYWYVYSIRALPEVLGATLFVTAMYSTFMAEKRPLRSFALLLICCAFMIVAHPRFAPCALLAAGFYFVNVLFIIPFARKTRTMYLICLILGVLSVGTYFLVNYTLFEGSTSYLTHGLFWAYPEGGWLILFSERGLFFSFPATVVMVIGLVTALLKDRKNLLLHLVALAALLGMMLSIGTADCWDGGPTMAGRYLVVVIPLLMPATVLLIKRTSAWGKGWMIFLFLYSAAYTLPCLLNMSDIGAGFLHKPLATIKQGLPLLRELFHPYFVSDIMVGHPYHGFDALTSNPFPLLLVITSVFLVIPRRMKAGAAMTGLIIFIGLSLYLHNLCGSPTFTWPPKAVEAALNQTPLKYARAVSCDSSEPVDLTEFANRFDDFRPASLTLDDLGARERNGVFSQPHLDLNGWEGKEYRWYTVVAPFRTGSAGPHKLTITGTSTDALTPILAVKEGAHVVYNEQLNIEKDDTLNHAAIINCGQHRGDTYVLLRLEGQTGTLRIEKVSWAPLINCEDDSTNH